MASTHGTFPSFLEMEKTAGASSLEIYDYLRQIQRETMAFLLIVVVVVVVVELVVVAALVHCRAFLYCIKQALRLC